MGPTTASCALRVLSPFPPWGPSVHHHHHEKALRNKSHTSDGRRPGLKRNKIKVRTCILSPLGPFHAYFHSFPPGAPLCVLSENVCGGPKIGTPMTFSGTSESKPLALPTKNGVYYYADLAGSE